MKIGFVGFGEVSYTLSKILLSKGFEVLTSLEGRSEKTKKLVNSLDVAILDNFEEVAKESNILISANSPNSALAIAIKYGSLTDGVFIDFNNISPYTAEKIANYLSEDHFIDAAIMGKVKSDELNIFFSGKKAKEFRDFIDTFRSNTPDMKLNIEVVSDKIGDVSKLKVLRSSFTKGVSSLLIETFELADKLDLTEDLWNVLSLTEGENFEKSSKSRIKNSYDSAKRKHEELDEILEFFQNIIGDEEYPQIMVNATKSKFDYLKDKNY